MELLQYSSARRPRSIFVEPFFLRCETCQARLRVRDERFLGQVQSCPKCGSMVHILAPPGLLSANEAAADAAPESAEVAATPASFASANAIAWVRDHVVLSGVSVATLVVTCGLMAVLALRGNDQVAAITPATPAVDATKQVAFELSTEPFATDESIPSYQEEDSAPVEPRETSPDSETTEPDAIASSSFLPLVSLDSARTQSVEPETVMNTEPARTLTLEPVETKPQLTPASSDVAATDYTNEEMETETVVEPPAAMEASPQVEMAASVAETPHRRTNIADQLSVTIESIDLPEMPIGDFVQLMSDMSDVPIELDAKVLGEVGLSTRATVKVQGDSTTVGKLLAHVLKEHQLTCAEREGTLVVIRRNR